MAQDTIQHTGQLHRLSSPTHRSAEVEKPCFREDLGGPEGHRPQSLATGEEARWHPRCSVQLLSFHHSASLSNLEAARSLSVMDEERVACLGYKLLAL